MDIFSCSEQNVFIHILSTAVININCAKSVIRKKSNNERFSKPLEHVYWINTAYWTDKRIWSPTESKKRLLPFYRTSCQRSKPLSQRKLRYLLLFMFITKWISYKLLISSPFNSHYWKLILRRRRCVAIYFSIFTVFSGLNRDFPHLLLWTMLKLSGKAWIQRALTLINWQRPNGGTIILAP